jgi:hypothetical protein
MEETQDYVGLSKKSENKIEKNRGILLIFCTKVYII